MTISDIFSEAFGYAPSGSGVLPGRVNLIGEHIDYNGGTVLPTALKNTISVAIAPNELSVSRVKSTRFDNTVGRSVDSTADNSWSDYVIGPIQFAKNKGWVRGNIDIAIDSNVPDGAGVSSSAALISVILKVLSNLAQSPQSPKAIAFMAKEVENDYCRVPCGIMDQMAVNLATYGEALALDTATSETELISIPENWRFLVIHSDVRRSLTDGRYEERFKECAAAAEALNTSELCLLDSIETEQFDQLPENLKRRVQHVHSEHHRSLKAINALQNGSMQGFGDLMKESHWSYSKDFEASTPEVDKLVVNALKLGAVGARLTGGGFGGCIVCLLEASNVKDFVDRLSAAHPEIWLV
jgi:galactokinase